MGKRQIGEMQPFEFIVTLIIADLACIPMADISIPLLYGIISILCLFLLHQLLSVLEQGGNFFKRIISGKPSLVIDKNGVNLYELKKNNLALDDLIESMRALGYFTFDDVSYAIYESNGKLSAMENCDKTDKSDSLPYLLIKEGKFQTNNLKKLSMNSENIIDFLKKNDTKARQVEIMTMDGNGRVYLQKKNKRYEILDSENLKEQKW